jgi:hypothetical protein
MQESLRKQLTTKTRRGVSKQQTDQTQNKNHESILTDQRPPDYVTHNYEAMNWAIDTERWTGGLNSQSYIVMKGVRDVP